MSADRQGWFADMSDEPADRGHPWQPCLQLDGPCLSLGVWFASARECLDFIESEVVGQRLLDSPGTADIGTKPAPAKQDSDAIEPEEIRVFVFPCPRCGSRFSALRACLCGTDEFETFAEMIADAGLAAEG